MSTEAHSVVDVTNEASPVKPPRLRRYSRPTPPTKEDLKKLRCMPVNSDTILADSVPVLDLSKSNADILTSSPSGSVAGPNNEVADPALTFVTSLPLPVDGQTAFQLNLSSSDIQAISTNVCSYIVNNLNDIISPLITTLTANLTTALNAATAEIVLLRDENERLSTQVDDLEQFNRRNSVRISGVPESRINNTEDTVDVVVQLMAKAGANIAASDIEQAYRIGKRIPQTPPNPLTPVVKRPIIVKFANRSTKKLSVKSKTKLPKGIYINDDLTKARSTVAFRTRSLVKSKAAKTTWTDDGKVFIIDNADKKHIVTTEKALDDLKKLCHCTFLPHPLLP